MRWRRWRSGLDARASDFSDSDADSNPHADSDAHPDSDAYPNSNTYPDGQL